MKNIKFKSTGAVIRVTNEEAQLLTENKNIAVYTNKKKQKSFANKSRKKLNNFLFGKVRAGNLQLLKREHQFSFVHTKTKNKISYLVHEGMRNSYDIKFD